MNWKIYYSDGQTFSDQDGDPEIAPFWDVQVIIQVDEEHGWFSLSGSKYYVWDNRGLGYCWWGVDDIGFVDYLKDPGWKRVLVGRTIENEEFNEIFKRAKRDPDFERKKAFRRWERRPIEAVA